jgi:hypothetical protein
MLHGDSARVDDLVAAVPARRWRRIPAGDRAER